MVWRALADLARHDHRVSGVDVLSHCGRRSYGSRQDPSPSAGPRMAFRVSSSYGEHDRWRPTDGQSSRAFRDGQLSVRHRRRRRDSSLSHVCVSAMDMSGAWGPTSLSARVLHVPARRRSVGHADLRSNVVASRTLTLPVGRSYSEPYGSRMHSLLVDLASCLDGQSADKGHRFH